MKALTILLAEDNEDHAELIIESLRDFNIGNTVFHVSNGEALLSYLYETYDSKQQSGLPDLILLDLKMPRMDGKATLQQIKSDSRFNQIPVIIVTTSTNAAEIDECYSLGANSYITKPLKFEELNRKIKELNLYWVITTELP